LWRVLGDTEADKAYAALWKLAASRRAAARIGERMPVVSAARFARLIAELDSEDFPVRESATRRLRRLGPTLEPALRNVLKAKAGLEVRRRVESLLQTWATPEAEAARRRAARGVEIRELLGSTESRGVLKALVGGPAGRVLTREAQAALRRLERRRAGRLLR
jgi:hypothetical protein